MNIFHENRTVIKYHCHKHASFLPIPFCVYSGFERNFYLKLPFMLSKTIYATHTIFRLSFFSCFSSSLYSFPHTVQYTKHNKKYLRFSLFNFFHFPDDFSLTFQCARFYLEFCYSSHFHAIELLVFFFFLCVCVLLFVL